MLSRPQRKEDAEAPGWQPKKMAPHLYFDLEAALRNDGLPCKSRLRDLLFALSEIFAHLLFPERSSDASAHAAHHPEQERGALHRTYRVTIF